MNNFHHYVIMQITDYIVFIFLKKDQYGDICANAKRQHEINGHFYMYLLLCHL